MTPDPREDALAKAREALKIGQAWTEEYLNEAEQQDIPAEVDRVNHGLGIIHDALTLVEAALSAPPSQSESNPMSEDKFTLHKIVDDNGETIHAFGTASFALPKDHWIYESSMVPPMPLRMGVSAARDDVQQKVREAAKYAIRASTMNGREEDFDPDAMMQNFIVGLFGFHTKDGLDTDDDRYNPKPVPPEFVPPSPTPYVRPAAEIRAEIERLEKFWSPGNSNRVDALQWTLTPPTQEPR